MAERIITNAFLQFSIQFVVVTRHYGMKRHSYSELLVPILGLHLMAVT